MKIDTKTTNRITREQVLAICNTVRSLGLSTGHTGTRLINKVIQILTIKDLEIVVLEEIYQELLTYYPNMTIGRMRKNILYALQNRDFQKSKDNFENIFGFEHDEYYFEPKVFMEEVANLIRIESI